MEINRIAHLSITRRGASSSRHQRAGYSRASLSPPPQAQVLEAPRASISSSDVAFTSPSGGYRETVRNRITGFRLIFPGIRKGRRRGAKSERTDVKSFSDRRV